jgi:hypothetical protein
VTYESLDNYIILLSITVKIPNNKFLCLNITGITDVVQKECRHLQGMKEVFHKSDATFDFSLGQTTNSLKTAPVTWSCLTTMAEGKNKSSDVTKVTAAACILLNSRSKFLSKLQHNVAVALYNNQLQREGFDMLHKMGITVAHSSLVRTIQDAAVSADRDMEKLKREVEENHGNREQQCVNVNDHDYALSTDQDVSHHNPAYRFNMDNLDFHIRVRDMTEAHQNQSKHYVQLMAVKDRVNCENLPDDAPVGDLNGVENSQLLPSAEDNDDLREDMIHIISLILIEHLPAFEVFQGVYPEYFQHQYSDVMDEKSVVVGRVCMNLVVQI